ncbi:MAG TPA: uridine diphosphate-N-acetylglucosamine-binding protein YvcK [Vicinamibacteria bacterium]|nr:uridine diphosphate-N-acetylglucosamine-binding protein YvcK [Vicinamibacteria bacterium]
MKDDLGWTPGPECAPASAEPPAPGARRPGPPGPLGALRVVAIGGGTGLPAVLAGLKRTLLSTEPRGAPPDRERLTAIVTVADDGGSSGRLRRAYSVLAPGDIRNCLLALSSHGVMSRLFGFRFAGDGDVGGHSLGNLILTALSLVNGDFASAVERAEEILAVRGRVLASTTRSVSLVGELEDGSRVRGESAIGRANGRVRRLRLEPEDAPLLPQARDALLSADLVVIGPGSLYTSLLPPLLLPGLAEAVAKSGARVVLIMNVMTERESMGLSAAGHVEALRRHAKQLPIHDVLLNTTPVPDRVLGRYAALGAFPVACDAQRIAALGCRPVKRRLLAAARKVRHDPRAVAAALLELVACDGREAPL